MAVPSLPARLSPDWFPWAQGLHNEVTTGRLSDAALSAAFAPWTTDWQIDADGASNLEFRLNGASDWLGHITDTGDFQVRGALVGQGFVNYGQADSRIPFLSSVIIDGSALTAANPADKVGMQNTVLFKGGFADEVSYGASNPNFIWGANDFVISGTEAGDLDGITVMYGRLIEVHAQAPGADLDVLTALQIEGHLEPSAVGGHVGTFYGLHILAPRNGGTIDSAVGVQIDSPTTGTDNVAFRITGDARTEIGGNIEMNADPAAPKTINAYSGGFKGKTVVVGNPNFYPSGASLTVQSAADDDVVSWLKGRGGQTGDIVRIGRDTVVHARFDRHGRFITNQTEAPLDADLGNGDLSLYVDSTSGAMKLMIKAKDAGGTVRTGSVALT